MDIRLSASCSRVHPEDNASPLGVFGVPLHHLRFLEWLGVPEMEVVVHGTIGVKTVHSRNSAGGRPGPSGGGEAIVVGAWRHHGF